MQYNGQIWRPPVEANTFLLPVTEGCTHNTCRFCSMFKDIPFRMLDLADVEDVLKEGVNMYHQHGMPVKRIYLIGGDPFAMNFENLKKRIDLIHKHAPECETITMYASIDNIARKSDEELRLLKEMGVDDLYVGIESGLDDVLEHINKGHTVAQAIEQCQRLNRIGIHHMSLLMLGVAGHGRGEENAKATAKLLNAVDPRMILLMSMTINEDMDLQKDVDAGTFTLATEMEMLAEEKVLIENLNLPDTYFWAAHSLDVVSLQGWLGDQQDAMIAELDHALNTLTDEIIDQKFNRKTRAL